MAQTSKRPSGLRLGVSAAFALRQAEIPFSVLIAAADQLVSRTMPTPAARPTGHLLNRWRNSFESGALRLPMGVFRGGRPPPQRNFCSGLTSLIRFCQNRIQGGDLGEREDCPLKKLGGGTEVLLSPNI